MPEALRTMVSGLTPELVFSVLVVLCGTCILGGAVWLFGRGGGTQRRTSGAERRPGEDGRA